MHSAPIRTSGSITQNSPMRTLAPMTAWGSTRAVGAMTAEGSAGTLFPDALGDAAIAVLDAIVLIQGGDGAQTVVVKALQAQGLAQVFFKVMQGLELVRGGGFSFPRRSEEELLKSAVHQDADFSTHEKSGPVVQLAALRNVRRRFAPSDTDTARLALDVE